MEQKGREELIDSYFEEIIKYPDDYTFLRSSLITSDFEKFLKDFINVIMDGVERWEIDYIFNKDKALPDNEKAMHHRIIEYERPNWFGKPETEITEEEFLHFHPLDHMDLAALTKLLQFRLFKSRNLRIFKPGISRNQQDDSNYDLIVTFILYIRDFRNDTSHRAADANVSEQSEEFLNDSDFSERIDVLLEYTTQIITRSERIFQRSNAVKSLMEETKERWIVLKEAYNYARNITPIEKVNKKEVTIKEIINYKIYFGHSAIHDKHSRILLDYLLRTLKSAGKQAFIDANSLITLSQELKKDEIDDVSHVKEIMKSLDNQSDSLRIFYVTNDTITQEGVFEKKDDFIEKNNYTGMNNFIEEDAVTRVKNSPDEKWCIITDRPWIAKEIWGLPNQNGIAIRIKDKNHFEVFTGEEKEEQIEEPQVGIHFGGNSQTQSDDIKKVISEERVAFPQESISYRHSSQQGNIDSVYMGTQSKDAVDEDIKECNSEKTSSEKLEEDIGVVQGENGDDVERFYDNKDVMGCEDPIEEIIKKIKIPARGGKVRYGSAEDEYYVRLEKKISGGGEGDTYDASLGDEYIKIYHADKITTERINKIKYMLDLNPMLPTKICWPTKEVYDMGGKLIVGYSMPVAAEDELAETLSNLNFMLLTSGKAFDREWSRTDLLTICINIAELFRAMHKSGDILMGDVNPDNILVGEGNEVYFIDVDSYQIGSYNCPVGRPEFTSPELYKRMRGQNSYNVTPRTLEDEYFACSVLYFYILFLGEFPYEIDQKHSTKDCIMNGRYRFLRQNGENEGNRVLRRSYIFQNLSEEIKDMFENTFSVSRARYSDEEWESAFRRMREKTSDSEDNPTLSNELSPNDWKENKDEYWIKIKCDKCGREFQLVQHKGHDYMHEWCPECKVTNKIAKMKIHRVRCKQCGRLWTINEWDADGKNSEKICCPDCDASFQYDDKGKIMESESDFKGEIEKKGSFAMKNFLDEWRGNKNDF